MAIISDNKPLGPSKQYPIASEGVAAIVLADVVDVGIEQTDNGPKPKVELYWVVDEKDAEGNYFVIKRKFTNSLHEKSNLYPIVVDLLGGVAPAPLPYDLEQLIGRANMGVIKHANGKGNNADKKYANIASMLPLKPGQAFTVPTGYIRAKDGGQYGRKRERNQQQASRTPAPSQSQQATAQAQQPANQQVADDDIPF